MLSVGLVCSEVGTGMWGSPSPSSIQALLAFLYREYQCMILILFLLKPFYVQLFNRG